MGWISSAAMAICTVQPSGAPAAILPMVLGLILTVLWQLTLLAVIAFLIHRRR
jgi:hypothetical protein